MRKYFVTHEGKQLGPWSVEEIRQALDQQKLFWSDFVYDETRADWIVLAAHPYFSQASQILKINIQQPAQQPTQFQADQDQNEQKSWYVLKGENQYGPFAYLELIRMLQAKNLYEYDYVRKVENKEWIRVAECEELSNEKIKELYSSRNPTLSEVFFRRKNSRINYGAPVIVHNNKRVWRGQSFELSTGGAGLIVDTKEFDPGQTLFLHFNVGQDIPPFNAICSIVSKRYIDEIMNEMKYGVKFTNISKEIQKVINQMTEGFKRSA